VVHGSIWTNRRERDEIETFCNPLQQEENGRIGDDVFSCNLYMSLMLITTSSSPPHHTKNGLFTNMARTRCVVLFRCRFVFLETGSSQNPKCTALGLHVNEGCLIDEYSIKMYMCI
jgi:hypothetical protein